MLQQILVQHILPDATVKSATEWTTGKTQRKKIRKVSWAMITVQDWVGEVD